MREDGRSFDEAGTWARPPEIDGRIEQANSYYSSTVVPARDHQSRDREQSEQDKKRRIEEARRKLKELDAG